MKKIAKKEARELTIRRGRASIVRTGIENLAVGEVLLISREDCKNKNGPAQVCRLIGKKSEKKYTINYLADNTGWIVERKN